jgi:hypothetical protein
LRRVGTFGSPNIPVWGRADEERRHLFETSMTIPLHQLCLAGILRPGHAANRMPSVAIRESEPQSSHIVDLA